MVGEAKKAHNILLEETLRKKSILEMVNKTEGRY
jgi:hypothetical protein